MSVWVPVDWHVLVVAAPGGAACAVLAGTAQMLSRDRDRDKEDAGKDALVYALADLTLRRARAVTRPHAVTRPLKRIF